MQNENLGPAEKILQTILSHADHLYHGRPGYVVSDPSSPIGVKWAEVTHRVEDGKKVVYRKDKVGKKTNLVRIGILQADNKITDTVILGLGSKIVGEYRPAGIFPEVAVWMYKNVADVYKMDNEFVAKWASYAFTQDHRDLKIILSAFLLCQSRKGDPVLDAGKVAFFDDDYRDVGQAMFLLTPKNKKEPQPKMLLRVKDVLSLPQIAQMNRNLGFGKSNRKPFLGRWNKTVEKFLQYREENPKMLEGLKNSGYRTTVMDLARSVGYKPLTPKFFETFRWRQVQAKDGRRTMAIGQEIVKAETWDNLTEEQICQKIMADKPAYKTVVGKLPAKIGLTRAIMVAAIEAGSCSNKDLVILTPTLEELGLMADPEISGRWQKACKEAEDQRSANIAKNVKSKELREKLQEAADVATQKAVAEVSKNIRVYFIVDRSGSMQGAIDKAKVYVSKFLQSFPVDRLHISTFNTIGSEIKLKHNSAVGVENAFKGITAAGGTHYSVGVRTLAKYKPASDEDAIMIFVGDEEDSHSDFVNAVEESGIKPMAFGLVRVLGSASHGQGIAVQTTAAKLGIPCFQIAEQTFEDPYAIPRVIRALIASTPVGTVNTTGPKRQTLVDQILNTKLLELPDWA